MDWMLSLASSFVVLLLLLPLAVGLLLVIALGIGFLVPASETGSRASFDCPFSKRRATVEFLISPESDRPLDVLSCSVFSKPYHIRCKKGCLAMAVPGWLPSPMMPRFALLADGGISYRGPGSVGSAAARPVGTPRS